MTNDSEFMDNEERTTLDSQSSIKKKKQASDSFIQLSQGVSTS